MVSYLTGRYFDHTMRGDHEYPYEPLPATDTPFAASLGDRAPSFNGIYGSAGSSPQRDERVHWGDDNADRSPHAESPLPPSVSQGHSPRADKVPERSLLKAGLKKSVNRAHLHQRESRARCYSRPWSQGYKYLYLTQADCLTVLQENNLDHHQ